MVVFINFRAEGSKHCHHFVENLTQGEHVHMYSNLHIHVHGHYLHTYIHTYMYVHVQSNSTCTCACIRSIPNGVLMAHTE